MLKNRSFLGLWPKKDGQMSDAAARWCFKKKACHEVMETFWRLEN
jgi:hypothetical protein